MLKKIQRRLDHMRFIAPFIKRNAQRNNYHPKNSIAIFANPRGGSNWLAEIISALPNASLILEPLNRGWYQTNGTMPIGNKNAVPTGDLDFWYYQPIPKDAQWQEAKIFFHELLNRQILPLSLIYENKISDIPKSELFVFKFCYANLLLPWLAINFAISNIHLVRHPCAVVASQMHHGDWDLVLNQKTSNFLLPEGFPFESYFEKYKSQLAKVNTGVENLTAMWCISNKELLEMPNSEKTWKTIYYEKLLIDRDKELKELFNWLDQPYNESIAKSSIKASRTTKTAQISNGSNFEAQLSKWKSQLNAKQVGEVQRILDLFEISTYSTNNIMPLNSKT